MIVRDEARMLKDALASVQPWLDEMVVVDTGSSDATVAIAKACGARVSSVPWTDSFAAARNASLRRARGDWILVIDADDRLLPGGGETMRHAVRTSKEHGYAFQIEERTLDGRLLDVRVSTVRLFRNQPDIRYHGRVHEEVWLRNDRRLGRWAGLGTGALVRHVGNDPALREPLRKTERNEHLLKLELAERPDDVHMWWLMVRFHVGAGNYHEAHGWLTRCRLADQARPCLMPNERAYLDQVETQLPVTRLGR